MSHRSSNGRHNSSLASGNGQPEDTRHPNDPSLRSWVESANDPLCDFPIQNLPMGVFARLGGPRNVLRVGVAIGDWVLDLAEVWPEFDPDMEVLAQDLFDQPSLNAFLAAGPEMWQYVRETVSLWLRKENPILRDNHDLRRRALLPMQAVEMLLPVEIGDYTDFYASEHHATNVGSMFRPDNPLMPNWKHLPVGYHGRASSIVVSGTPVRRPIGQTKADDAEAPTTGPCRLLDFELEVGFITGPGNPLGHPIDIEDAPDHIFGLVLLNDWSARDIQKWEYQPLGPFLAKNFATTISPWVVPLAALEPYRVKTERKPTDPKAQPYLDGAWDFGFDIHLFVDIQTAKMRETDHAAHTIVRTNFRHMYWNICQMLAHQTITGCNVNPGDLYGSGTVSGPEKGSRGCLLELCWRGQEPLTLPGTNEKRAFLADGDLVTLRGFAGGDPNAGTPRIGFGECAGVVVEAGA